MKRLQSVVRGWKYIKYKSQYTQFLFNTFPIVHSKLCLGVESNIYTIYVL